ncbi:SHOCT domain-containing protein [Halorubrum sp. HHNYT27]|uniref:SHOCT domain-containing protein n=1 Tax=Halorubrum sp. HHNYT27 TaxID=3402275 RepID=UPI003EBDA176
MSSQITDDGILRIVLVVLAILVLAPMFMMALAFPMMGMWGGGMMGDYVGYGGSALWGLGMMLTWLIILVGGGYLAYRWIVGSDGVSTDPALEELRLAYARGDIDEEEYEERRTKLGEE